MTKLNKKRNLFFGVCASFILLAAGCGNNEDTTESESSVDESSEVITSASISDKPEDVLPGLSENGTWIYAITDDVTVEEDIMVAGTFHDGGEDSGDVYRKLALYAQDEDRNVTDEYTLTAPSMTVESPNFRIQNGTFAGDVIVKEEGFELADSTIEGNVTFDSQELMDSAKLDEGTVTGEISVAE
ncbi:polymer-forming cytoskeletal protein [Desemzia sp. RIT804]|uniref:polymer-forming cytoskeletal protein n=1 Tax=Desemzia sp. RIT 804 TaxID=2810209 RepID=UPI0019514A36|nr:polymer-forming cytoskeletal protein [Desemzia sp. RIT 804]MBM6615722.1 polymer-forming cytoskeletal protein [Desemzia sp. RIT 804]